MKTISDELLQKNRDTAESELNSKISRLTSQLDDHKAAADFKNEILYPMQQIKKKIQAQVSIPEILYNVAESQALFEEAAGKIEDRFLPPAKGPVKQTKTIKAALIVQKIYLESEADADDYVNILRVEPGIVSLRKTFGSLISIPETLSAKLSLVASLIEAKLKKGDIFERDAADKVKGILQQAIILPRKYDCVVTNPPYMGGKGMNGLIKLFLKDNYTDVKSDLFSAFIMRNTSLALPNCQLGFMSPFVWMFISSYEKLRYFLIDRKTITSLIQLEYSGFDGATVPICTFTIENAHHPNFKGGYVRLSDFRGSEIQGRKALEIIRNYRKSIDVAL